MSEPSQDPDALLHELEGLSLDDEAVPSLASRVASALDARGEAGVASFWHELAGLSLIQQNALEEASVALRRAIELAGGVRRLVLLRRLAEQEIAAGEVKAAQQRLATVSYVGLGDAGEVPKPIEPLLDEALNRDPLDDWRTLGSDEAAMALELARGEALSQLGEADETRRAYEAAASKMALLRSDATPALWARWVKIWSWFLGEMLGEPAEAERACAHVRSVVDPQTLEAPRLKAALLRAEQISASRVGDSARSRKLAEEYLSLTQQLGEVTEEVSAWNAMGILQMSAGELPQARAAFDRSLQLSRQVGLKRREMIAQHNLGLALCELGELEEAIAAQEDYRERSLEIANEPAKAYGPASVAVAAIALGDHARAEECLATAREVAEDNAWPFVLAWCRGLSGHLRLARYLEKRDTLQLSFARSDYLACLDVLEEQAFSWTEEMDPGEFHAGYALSLAHAGKTREAAADLKRAAEGLDPTCVTSHAWVRAALAIAEGRPLGPELEWFEARGYMRAVRFLRGAGLG